MVHPQISKPPSKVIPDRTTSQFSISEVDLSAIKRSRRNVRIGQYQSRPFSNLTSNRIAKRLKYPLMATAGFVCAFLLWEGILRLTVESTPGTSIHPALGIIQKPGLMLHTKEGHGLTQLNSLGMRSPEPTTKKPEEYRILMLGDSYTRADEVGDGVNFSDRLQVALDSVLNSNPSDIQSKDNSALAQTEPTPTVKVINAGKPSASPAGYLYAADFHRRTFSPDSTVVQLTEHDFTLDMNNSASEFYAQKIGDNQYKPTYNERFGNANPLAQRLTENMPYGRSLMQMSTLRLGGRNLQQMIAGSTDTELEAAPAPSLAAERTIEKEDAALVEWTVEQLNQQFPNLVLVFLPAMNYKDAGEVSSDPRNAAIESDLESAAQAQDVPLLNMRADFLHHYRTQGTNLRGFNNTKPGEGHLNATGHAIVAKRLSDFYTPDLRQHNWLARPPESVELASVRPNLVSHQLSQTLSRILNQPLRRNNAQP